MSRAVAPDSNVRRTPEPRGRIAASRCPVSICPGKRPASSVTTRSLPPTNLEALVAVAKRLEAGLRRRSDEAHEVQGRLLAGVEAVLGDVGDVEERANQARRADAVEVLGDRQAVQQGRAVAVRQR